MILSSVYTHKKTINEVLDLHKERFDPKTM